MRFPSLLGLLAGLSVASAVAAPQPRLNADGQLNNPQFFIADDTNRTVDILFGEVARLQSYDDLWARVRAGFAMPELDDPLVEKWENYYASRPEYLNRIIERGGRYLYFVVDDVERRGMPMELALLPMIESAYNPKAESSAKAAGMWQFMPATGKQYGLERTWWYDGRRDVVAATDAALDYLDKLHGQFNDWQLALASYNWGENAVARAQTKSAAAGLGMTYSDLRMPNETRNYVPKLMAVRNIIANPAAFGVTLASVPNKPYFAAVSTGRHMDVQVAADLSETPVQELLKLNPGFIRPVIAYKDDRKLVIPADKVAAFQRNLANYDKPLLNWQPYVTKRGESFAQLASQFGIDVSELKDINDIGSDGAARGQTILVPNVPGLDVSNRQTLVALHENRTADPIDTGASDAPLAVIKYRVARGDTLFNIASRYGMNVADLRKLNQLKADDVRLGSTLKVASVTRTASGKKAPIQREYVVKNGDTLASIARKHRVDADDLKRWNPQKLSPGIRLVIYQPPA
ncbi:lytic transglycosylase [Jeongeupia sp. HS-3]|uniref:lytic transglycosylase n=1 Tax=Jeongeupia sp. HS-3 TaxID=1009682 RepID=UPI0018A53594|nr:LysM peptidoglycan-binding domain-containing protein [Jeongeupia sp. HS-3]BCL76173.1 lytic transglycosylase [Jeongeupia sp. HS-3]